MNEKPIRRFVEIYSSISDSLIGEVDISEKIDLKKLCSIVGYDSEDPLI